MLALLFPYDERNKTRELKPVLKSKEVIRKACGQKTGFFEATPFKPKIILQNCNHFREQYTVKNQYINVPKMFFYISWAKNYYFSEAVLLSIQTGLMNIKKGW